MPSEFRFIAVLVEGQTEEKFINDVLCPHFESYKIFLSPTILNTKITKVGPNFKGGINSFGQVKRDLRPLLHNTSASMITTMFDLYDLPSDFPGYSESSGLRGVEKAQLIEAELKKRFGDSRFEPYLSVHEFEALLFADVSRTSEALGASHLQSKFQKIRNQFSTPEDINDNPKTCPSRRITNLFEGYEKPLYGTLCTKKTGITILRSACPHFDEWITMMETV